MSAQATWERFPQHAIVGGSWRVVVAPDPLGPVNKILTLMRGQERVRSVPWPVPVGARVRLVRDEFSIPRRWLGPSWQELCGLPAPEDYNDAIREPGWRIEVDDHTVLAVTDAELRPPYVPPPAPPWWQRIRRAVRRRARDVADQIAGELGYHRADECGGWDE